MRLRAGSRRRLIIAVALVALAGSTGLAQPGSAGAAVDPLETLPKSATWIQTLNAWRAASGLPAVAENPTWSAGAVNHSEYVIEADDFGHDEDNGGPFSTPEGIAAGANGNVAVSNNATKTDRAFVEQWLSAPFHAAGMVDPLLVSSGYGAYRSPGATPWPAAATLDVLRGRTGAAATAPTFFPGDGSIIPLAQSAYRGGESPDPLSPCAGYGASPINTGLPLFALLPSAPTGTTTATLTRNGALVESCVYDETSYTNPDSNAQTLGRQVLASRHQVVIVPRRPLTSGSTYVAHISYTPTGMSPATAQWSFTARPQLSIGNASVVEGRSSSRSVRLTVSLSGPSANPVTVSYATAPGTAVAGSDYTTKSGTLTLAPGATSATISVPVKGDRLIEANEAFTVKLSNPQGADLRRSSGSVSVITDDRGSAPPTGVRVSIGSPSVMEGNAGSRALRFTVALSAVPTSAVKVHYVAAPGTATASSDFSTSSGNLTIPAGSTAALISIRVKADTVAEPSETFTVRLSAALGGVIDRPTGTGTILNDD